MGFSGTPRHHVIPQPQPQPLPRALLDAEFVFVHDNASKPPLSPLYRGPSRVLQRSEKFFVLQIGDKSDSVSVDRLKPVFSSYPLVPAKPPHLGWPCLVPASVPGPPVPRCPPVKKVSFAPVPAPPESSPEVRGSPPHSAVLRHHLLGGVTVATTKTTFRTSGPHPAQRVQRYCAGLFGSVGLETKSISSSFS